MQFDSLWSSSSKISSDLKAPKASISNRCERCYNLNLNALCDQTQPYKVEQLHVESCDEEIGKENFYDHLKIEVKRLEQKVRVLEKQVKT